jgi:hypothetical protein
MVCKSCQIVCVAITRNYWRQSRNLVSSSDTNTHDVDSMDEQRNCFVMLLITSSGGPFVVYGLASEAPSFAAEPMIAGCTISVRQQQLRYKTIYELCDLLSSSNVLSLL